MALSLYQTLASAYNTNSRKGSGNHLSLVTSSNARSGITRFCTMTGCRKAQFTSQRYLIPRKDRLLRNEWRHSQQTFKVLVKDPPACRIGRARSNSIYAPIIGTAPIIMFPATALPSLLESKRVVISKVTCCRPG
jgi:hypothetical protein